MGGKLSFLWPWVVQLIRNRLVGNVQRILARISWYARWDDRRWFSTKHMVYHRSRRSAIRVVDGNCVWIQVNDCGFLMGRIYRVSVPSRRSHNSRRNSVASWTLELPSLWFISVQVDISPSLQKIWHAYINNLGSLGQHRVIRKTSRESERSTSSQNLSGASD